MNPVGDGPKCFSVVVQIFPRLPGGSGKLGAKLSAKKCITK